MAKRPAEQPQQRLSWTVYQIAAKQEYVGRVDAPDEQTAIARAIVKYQVPPNERDRLMARQRD